MMKIDDFRRELTDISATKEALVIRIVYSLKAMLIGIDGLFKVELAGCVRGFDIRLWTASQQIELRRQCNGRRLAVLPFPKFNKIFVGYFDPEKIIIDSEN